MTVTEPRTDVKTVRTSGLPEPGATARLECEAKTGFETERVARWALLALLAVMVAVFAALKPSLFLTVQNARVILETQAVTMILAVAAVFPLIVGQIDLSFAAVCGVGQLLFIGFSANSGLPVPVALVLAVAVCTGIGAINGLLVTRIGINSLISTLGLSTAIGGLMTAYTGGGTITVGVPDSLLKIARGTLFGFPLSVYYMIAIALIAWYVLEQTPFGRYLYAIGGSREAARLSGINVRRLSFTCFVIAGFLSGIAGILTASRMGVGDPNAGFGFLLPVLAGALLGAAAIKLGTYNIAGTVVAVFTVAVGVIGLQLMGAPYWIEPVFNGLALVIAVGLTRYLRREAL